MLSDILVVDLTVKESLLHWKRYNKRNSPSDGCRAVPHTGQCTQQGSDATGKQMKECAFRSEGCRVRGEEQQ